MTTEIMFWIFAPFVVATMWWCEGQRGHDKEIERIAKLPALLIIGYLCAVIAGHPFDWQAIAITVTIAFVHNFSYGEPMGHAITGRGGMVASDGSVYEKWQIGSLKTNPWAALAVRGAMLGLAAVPLASQPDALRVAIVIGGGWALAFPAAPAIVRFVLKMSTRTKAQAGAAWSQAERLRGGLAAGIAYLITITL